MEKNRKIFLGGITLAAAAGVGYLLYNQGRKKSGPELKTVPFVDLERYLGTWYDIAHYPNRFQRGCKGATAEYTKMADGEIRVKNTCYKRDTRKADIVNGSARVSDKTTNAKLKVQFFWPFAGDYWIIELDKDYQWAVVGEPGRKYLWILSRTQEIPHNIGEILALIASHGYDPDKLHWEDHH